MLDWSATSNDDRVCERQQNEHVSSLALLPPPSDRPQRFVAPDTSDAPHRPRVLPRTDGNGRGTPLQTEPVAQSRKNKTHSRVNIAGPRAIAVEGQVSTQRRTECMCCMQNDHLGLSSFFPKAVGPNTIRVTRRRRSCRPSSNIRSTGTWRRVWPQGVRRDGRARGRL